MIAVHSSNLAGVEYEDGVLLKRDNTILDGQVVSDNVSVQLDIGASLKGSYEGRFAWAYLGDGYQQLPRYQSTTNSLGGST